MSKKWIDLGPESEIMVPSDIVTAVSSESTDGQVPSAKCLKGIAGDIALALSAINTGVANIDIAEGVTFFDYDGTILYHWVQDEVASRSSLPSLPTRDGLVCQEWNWALSEIKSAVAGGGFVHVGATYTTSDGKTRLYVTIPNIDYLKSITIGFSQTVSDGVSVNWGDGSAEETVSGTGSNKTATHVYDVTGDSADFVITLEVTSGTMKLGGQYGVIDDVGGTQPGVNSPFATSRGKRLTSVEIGDGVTGVASNAFQYHCGIERISIPKTATVFDSGEGRLFLRGSGPCAVIFPRGAAIGDEMYQYNSAGCSLLCIPPNATLSGSTSSFLSANAPRIVSLGVSSIPQSMFNQSYGLNKVSLCEGVTSIGSSAFYNCYHLTSIKLPQTLTSIGSQAFYNCSALRQIDIPPSVSTIGSSVFRACGELEEVLLPENAAISSPGSLFRGCYSLRRVRLPSGLTSIGEYMFSECRNLRAVDIPSSVTSIGTYAFDGCWGISSLAFPSGLTSISSDAFSCTKGWSSGVGVGRLKTFDFRRALSVPTLSSTNAFYDTFTDREIIVPDELYEDWIAANNWNSSTYSIKETIVKASESSLGPLT